MRNTARTIGNFPAGLEALTKLRGNHGSFLICLLLHMYFLIVAIINYTPGLLPTEL